MTDVLVHRAAAAASLPEHARTRRRGARVRVVVVVAAAALLAGEATLGVTTWHAHGTLAHHRRSLRAATLRLRATGRRLSARRIELRDTQGVLRTRTAERDTAAGALAAAQRDLATAKVGLADARAQASANGDRIGALSTCLAGAQEAVLRIDAGDANGAVGTLRGVQAACDAALTSAGGDGPVFPFDFADPFVLRVGDVYFAYSTNAGAGNIQVISSTDLRHWQLLGNGLPHLPAWAARDATWAPAVLARPGSYLAYYTVRDAASGDQCISSAISLAPAGPYLDDSTAPLVCQHDRGGSIDPSPFVDGRGQPWLLWKSESGGGTPGAIWSAPLTPDGRVVAGTGTRLIQADQAWEGGVVEAPAMVAIGGAEVLFYSGNAWSSRDYAIGMALCASPSGPCGKPRRTPVLASHGAVAGPGGAELFTDASGALWMAYHAYSEPHVGYPASRLLRLARVTFSAGGPVFTSPS